MNDQFLLMLYAGHLMSSSIEALSKYCAANVCKMCICDTMRLKGRLSGFGSSRLTPQPEKRTELQRSYQTRRRQQTLGKPLHGATAVRGSKGTPHAFDQPLPVHLCPLCLERGTHPKKEYGLASAGSAGAASIGDGDSTTMAQKRG